MKYVTSSSSVKIITFCGWLSEANTFQREMSREIQELDDCATLAGIIYDAAMGAGNGGGEMK